MKRILLLVPVLGLLLANEPAVRKIGSPILLVDQETNYMSPKWSPDGKHLAITGASYRGIYLFTFTGNEVNELTDKLGAELRAL